MKILECDCCHVQVNDYAHWYNGQNPRSMYELRCVHEIGENTYDGMILCRECLAKLIYGAESED